MPFSDQRQAVTAATAFRDGFSLSSSLSHAGRPGAPTRRRRVIRLISRRLLPLVQGERALRAGNCRKGA